MGCALLDIEGNILTAHLSPYQFAVKIQAGVEVNPHMARSWVHEWSHEPDKVMLDFDQANAHNTVDRASVLQQVHELEPGLAR